MSEGPARESAAPAHGAGGHGPTAVDTAVCAVVVTYSPDLERLDPLLTALGAQCARVVVVDNGPGGSGLEAACERHGAELVALGENTGIANAQNVGIERAVADGATHVLLSDQDSLPAPDMVAELLAGLDRGEGQGRGPVGAVGPVAGDVRSETEELVYVSRRWGPRRARPDEVDDDGLIDAAFLIASGCLVPAAVLERVGPMNADWFIDHVDLEWGLRARRAGYRLLAVTTARLDHALGDSLVKLPGRAQEVHVHSAFRTYFLARNTVLLLRSGLLPPAWAVGYAVWLGKYVAFNSLLVPGRIDRARRMMRGVVDGVLGRTGPAR
ncbi:glycosyltransferase family 2 protein [Georgenia sp. Z1344]|uniref:glycosyltransferase family 2 protein n=1 Tax=Georgenia sp. Z1344 TaxID=3416706 RepID=UPI003CF5E1A4